MPDPEKSKHLMNPPRPLKPANAIREAPGSAPPLLTPPRQPPPPIPVAIPRKPTITPTNPPPPMIHPNHRGLQSFPQPVNSGLAPGEERPTVGPGGVVGHDPNIPRGVFAGTPLVNRPPLEAHRANLPQPESDEEPIVVIPDIPNDVCPKCEGSGMVDIKRGLDGVIYHYLPCPCRR